ncbi:MAG: ATP-grasp domain-containing protein [Planctomycetota bacterium]
MDGEAIQRGRASHRRPLVLLVGFRAGIVRAAERLGVDLAVVDRRPPSALLRPRLCAALVHEWSGPVQALVDEAQRALAGRSVAAVLALTEGAVLPAAHLRAAFGAPGSDVETAERCSDKRAMKAAIRAAGMSCAPYAEVTADTTAEGIVERLGLPLVLKHPRSSGSRGQCIAHDLDAVRRELRGRGLAEGFVRGVEMSVEGFFRDGELLFMNTTEYLVPLHASLVPSAVGPELGAELRALLVRATEALGLRIGVTHMEVFLTDSGLVFGELAARPPGGRLMPLMQRAYGFDPYEALLRIALRRPVSFPSEARLCAGSWVLHPGAGRLARVSGLEAAARVPGVRQVLVRVREGDTILPREGSGQDIGYIDAEGADRDAVARALHAARAALQFDLVPTAD